MDADVVIVGAGPVGCATAIGLGRRGHRVVVLERGGFPREKVCGEGLMPHGVRELRALGVQVEGLPFEGIAYHAGGTVALARFPRGRGLGVRRLRLDEAMADACAEVAELRCGVRVTDVGPGWVSTSAGRLRARAVVGADGLSSLVRRKLGLAGERRDAPRYGARRHYRIAVPDRDVVDVHMVDGFELYLTPTAPGEANVALLCERDVSRGFAGDLDAGFERLVRSHRPVADFLDGAEPLNAARLCGPLRQRVRGVVADRALLVGDAAGFVDAITGEGMSIGLASARLAVEALHEGLVSDRLSAEDLRGYERAYRQMARDLTWLTEIVLAGIRRPWLARHVVRNLAHHPDTFSRLLGVNSGQVPITSLRPRDVWRLIKPA